MPPAASSRPVPLVRRVNGNTETVVGTAICDFPASRLAAVQRAWESARTVVSQAMGGHGLEHDHWDWTKKSPSVRSGVRQLVAIEADGEVQGLMAVYSTPREARADPNRSQVIYVDYVETAPWNLREAGNASRFLGVGTVLIAEAVRISLDAGCEGRLGLHSLPQAKGFYEVTCQMTRYARDPAYQGLAYFEYTKEQATQWLASIGISHDTRTNPSVPTSSGIRRWAGDLCRNLLAVARRAFSRGNRPP